jgi:hypothetical protein
LLAWEGIEKQRAHRPERDNRRKHVLKDLRKTNKRNVDRKGKAEEKN